MSRLYYFLWAITLFLPIFSTNTWAKDDFIQLSQQQIDNLGIKIGALQPAPHIPLFTAPAKVVVAAANEFIISTSLAGLVTKMNVSVGDKASKGELVALVNSPELLTLQGNYLKATGAMKLAAASYNRNKTLRKEGVVSGRSEQESYSQYSASTIEANEAKQLLQIAGMSANEIKQLASTGRLTSQLSIKPPISGTVIERMVVPGTRVDAQTPLYRIAKLAQLWLEISVPQQHANDLKIGGKVEVEGGLADAEIMRLGESVNPDNQTIQARALITSNPGSVRFGQKVTVEYRQESTNETYWLPDTAIVRHIGKAYIFLKARGGFKATEINILGQQSGASVISGSLAGSEAIAVSSTVTLKAHWLGLGESE